MISAKENIIVKAGYIYMQQNRCNSAMLIERQQAKVAPACWWLSILSALLFRIVFHFDTAEYFMELRGPFQL